MKSHMFEFGGGRVVENGKSNWPDCITINMGKHEAWDLVQNLVSQLRDSDRVEFRYSSCGKITINIDE
jgi:phage-related protein